MSTNGRKPYEQKRKQKKPKRDARKKTKTKCKWIYLFQPTKICESMGNPRIREEAMEEKKRRRRLHWWRSNKWPESDAQTWKQKKTKNEELIGNSRPSLKKSPCDRLSRTDMSSLKKEKQKTPPAKGHDMNWDSDITNQKMKSCLQTKTE